MLIVLAACRESAADAGWRGSVETLPNGAAHVRNPSVGMWGTDDGWSVVEEVRLGALDSEGPEMFGEISGLQLDEQGRMYVLDSQAREIRVFDPEGRHLRTFGRKGGGPGEFEQPSALLWGADGNLWVVDQQNSRFAVFDTAGNYLTSHPRQGGLVFMPWPGGIDAEGHVHDMTLLAGSPPTRALTRHDRNLQVMDTFIVPEHRPEVFELRSANRIMMMAVPFSPFQVWKLSPQGDVWLGINSDYRLHRVNYSGDTVQIVEREFEPLPVTEADLKAGEEGLQRFVEEGGKIDMSRVPDVKPAFRSLAIDEEGYLWVRPNADVAEQDHLFDIFDPEGRFLGRIRSDFPITPAAPLVIRGNSLLAVSQDELGVDYVVRARIEGRE